jgi:hypothetical protein
MRILFMGPYGDICDYSVEKHRPYVSAFLVWSDLILATRHCGCKEAYLDFIRSIGHDPGLPVGAGKCSGVAPEFLADYPNFPNIVVRWYSDELEICTPVELIQVVLKELHVREQGDYSPY